MALVLVSGARQAGLGVALGYIRAENLGSMHSPFLRSCFEVWIVP